MFRCHAQLLTILTLVLAVIGVTPAPALAQSLTRQFSYQGYLENAGAAYNGSATVSFLLYSVPVGGAPRDTVTVNNVSVVKGIFTTVVNFGDDDTSNNPIYDGRPLYIDVIVNIGSGNVLLSPRQPIHPAPYALSMPNITANGVNIGIGTVTPQAKLDVLGETRSATLTLTDGGVRKGGPLPATTHLGLFSLNASEWLRLVSNNAPMHFFLDSTQGTRATPNANSAAMSVVPPGRVGIGTMSPTAKIHVLDTESPLATLQSSSTVGSWFNLQNTSAGGRNWSLVSTGSGNGEGPGKLIVSDQTSGLPRMTFDNAGNVGIGTEAPTERLHVNGNIRARVVIIEGGADLAEAYDVAPIGNLNPIPGMVVSIDPDRVGKLRIASTSYDHAVAGIISGADNVAPGLVLGHKGTIADGQFPIANVGRVWCYVDADAGGPVKPGDLLTTSSTPGHAMKATPGHAAGATLGKAMSRLENGKGLVLVLVTLQ